MAFLRARDPMNASTEAPGRRAVLAWLITGCTMIVCMVAIGGITRLTDSGLSITEWKPIMGALPPMNGEEWNEAFEKYKAIPEFAIVNSDMDLAGFKRIFFWEYLHRNWGRLMGLVFAVPFLLFLRKGWLKGWLLRRAWAILVAGGLVGALGWFMVASGLEERVDVSHYRLAIHLCAALTVLSIVLWTVFDLMAGRRSFRALDVRGVRVRLVLGAILLQVVWGAFTAGLDGGLIYNTWPLMNGEFMPENVRAFGSWTKDFTDHRDGVQFVHRYMAWVVALAVLFVRWSQRKAPWGRELAFAVPVVLLQFALGVFTLLGQVPLALGVLHQAGAVLLVGVWLKVVHASGRSVDF